MADMNFFGNYNTKTDYSYLFPNATDGINLSDYAMIKNGTYGKLMKAYYAKQEEDNLVQSEDATKKSSQMKAAADSLKQSAAALGKASLWEKKQTVVKDEITGEESVHEDYDREAIAKAVKAFVTDYNAVISLAGESDTKDVLRNAAWMTDMTDVMEKLLSNAGIAVGDDNKLSLDEEAIKKANINTLKTIFTGHNSFADKVGSKAGTIAKVSARAVGTYNSKGTYSNVLADRVATKVDQEI